MSKQITGTNVYLREDLSSEEIAYRDKMKIRQKRQCYAASSLGIASVLGIAAYLIYYYCRKAPRLPPDPSLGWPKNGSLSKLDLQGYIQNGFSAAEIQQVGKSTDAQWDSSENAMAVNVFFSMRI